MKHDMLFKVKELDILIKKYMNNKIDNLSNSNCKLLHYLGKHNEVTQKELEGITFLSKSTLSESLTIMEKESLIIRENKNGNTKNNYVRLTDLGKEKVKHLDKYFEKVNKLFLNGISEEEMNIFYNVIDKIEDNIRKEEYDD